MAATASDRPTRRPTKFTATAAAKIALAGRPRRLSPARGRIVRAATVLWCRHLQFPPVRAIGAAIGLSSPSTPVKGFGRTIDIQAAVIGTEWQRIVDGWLTAPRHRRPSWLVDHGRDLAAMDPACLRLPGLVCSAVLGSGALPQPPSPADLVPLHALAALVDVASPRHDDTRFHHLLEIVATLDPTPPATPDLAVPA